MRAFAAVLRHVIICKLILRTLTRHLAHVLFIPIYTPPLITYLPSTYYVLILPPVPSF